jgi:hypothetical protein
MSLNGAGRRVRFALIWRRAPSASAPSGNVHGRQTALVEALHQLAHLILTLRAHLASLVTQERLLERLLTRLGRGGPALKGGRKRRPSSCGIRCWWAEALRLAGERPCAHLAPADLTVRGVRREKPLPGKPGAVARRAWPATSAFGAVDQDGPGVGWPGGPVGCPDVSVGEATAPPPGGALRQRRDTSDTSP